LSNKIGKPIEVAKVIGEPSAEQIDELHGLFIKEMQRLFERTKAKNGCPNAKLEIL
jgi:hypothetical protein